MNQWVWKRNRAVGLVVKERQLLVIERLRHGQHYFSLPGGGIERGETAEQAAVREVEEETTVVAKPLRVIYHHHYPKNGDHYYALCEYVSGEPRLGEGEERWRQRPGINEFKPQWQRFDDITKLKLRPYDIFEWLVTDLAHSFPSELRQATITDSRWSH